MSLALLLPLGLAALAAWLVPLLIHLRRRDEQQRTVFAALRFLPARARPRTRLRFEEWLLLSLRLLLIAAIALLIAQPVLFGGPHEKHWRVVAPGVDPAALSPEDFRGEQRWLASGFPSLQEPPPRRVQHIGSLLRELDATLPRDTVLTVIVPAQLDGADAAVPVLGRRVEWRIVPGTSASASSAQRPALPRPPLAIRHSGKAVGLRYLSAAASAWRAVSASASPRVAPDIAPVEQALPATTIPLVWLAPGALPRSLAGWVERGGSVLLGSDVALPGIERHGVALWRDEAGEPLVLAMRHGRGRYLQWTRPLTADAMPELLQAEFPERVWSLFAPPVPAPARVPASDYAPVRQARTWPAQPRDLQPYLLVAIAALFVLERLLASGRRAAVRA
jgi:hypothetical protein